MEQFGNSLLPSLYQDLNSALQASSQVLLMIGAVCSTVFMKDEIYYFFDSHSHGKDGISGPDGSSVLLSFDYIEDLITYLYALYESISIELSFQFEILPIDFTIFHQKRIR